MSPQHEKDKACIEEVEFHFTRLQQKKSGQSTRLKKFKDTIINTTATTAILMLCLSVYSHTAPTHVPVLDTVLNLISLFAGYAFGVKAFLKFREYLKGKTLISQPVTLSIVSLLLVLLPALMNMPDASIAPAVNHINTSSHTSYPELR